MAIINDFSTENWLTIDPTSKAARLTEYDSSGLALVTVPSSVFMLPVHSYHNVFFTSPVYDWSMYVGAPEEQSGRISIRIKRLYLNLAFDGNEAANSAQVSGILFYNAIPTGGTQLIPVALTDMPANSRIFDARTGVSLTVTDVTFLSSYPFTGHIVNRKNAEQQLILDSKTPLILAPGQGLVIRMTLTSGIIQADCSFSGFIIWEEFFDGLR